jgi:hypothetical protein
MPKTLIVGCSYVHQLKFYQDINTEQFDLFGSPGAGNQAIAARALHQINTVDYDEVLVLWSGVNRLDMPVSQDLHRVENYKFFDMVDTTIWYHSGGIGCSGQSPEAPKIIKKYFDAAYFVSSNQSLSHLTLNNIFSVQQRLQVKQIPYRMAFIYDINDQSRQQHEVSHGFLDPICNLYSHINWQPFVIDSPYNWARSKKQLKEDNYYPTEAAFLQWFKEQLDVDLLQ